MADDKKNLTNLEEDFKDFKDFEEENINDIAQEQYFEEENVSNIAQEESEEVQEELNKEIDEKLETEEIQPYDEGQGDVEKAISQIENIEKNIDNIEPQFEDFKEDFEQTAEQTDLQAENFEEDFEQDFSHKFDDEHQLEEIQKKLMEQCASQGFDEYNQSSDITPWQQEDEEDSAIKKYIFYVSKDFVPYIDDLSMDERSAYINDAIQTKIDLENEEIQKEKKKKALSHLTVMILTMCLCAPVVLFCVHKTIMATFENYKYSQENFEKLYKSRFAKDKAYMRSVQYNKQTKTKSH